MLAALLRKYQDFNPATRRHDCPRTLREYARLLGVSHVALVQIYGGQRAAGGKVIRGLFRAFPDDVTEISKAVADEGSVIGEAEVA